MGAGRCGTTFLWEMFKELGFDTGEEAEFFQNQERLGLTRIPRVIKGTGGLCINLDMYVKVHHLQIEHIFLCTRQLGPMVASQLQMKQDRGTYKGLRSSALQAKLYQEIPGTFGKALLQIADSEYPFSIVKFPKSAEDPDYLARVLKKSHAEGFDYLPEFNKAWDKVVKPELIRNG
jgi:hypothetical protein